MLPTHKKLNEVLCTVVLGDNGASRSGWGHPKCSDAAAAIAAALPTCRS